MAAEKGDDDFLSFAPESLFRSENPSEANTSANMNNGVNQTCAVVGGFLQRGAKLQALQKLCRQLSTPVSIPCTPLTIPTRFASSWVKPSHKRISAAKLVNRLKRKPATDFSRYSKKQRFADQGLSLSRRESGSGHKRHGEGIVRNLSTSENVLSISGEEAEDLLQDHDTPPRGQKELNTDISNNHSETTTGVDEKLKPELCDSDLQLVQDCDSRFLGNNDSSPSKSISQQYHCGIEDLPKENHPSNKTPNTDPSSMSILMYCTESLPQGLNEQTTEEPVLNSAREASEPLLVPRRGRVRGKRTKSMHWRSCIQMPSSDADEASVSPTCDENHTSGDGSNEPKLSPEGRDSGVQADPDFFPYMSSCLTSK